jgi:DNA polymerase-3 subunit epsilon
MVAFLDTEITGLSFDDRILEIAVIGYDNEVLFHSLTNPERPISQRIQALTGFSPEMVSNQPTLYELLASLRNILVEHGPVIIYNEKFDRRFFPADFWEGIETRCALDAFRKAAGNGGTLDTAARLAGHEWDGPAHRAITDARACRTVWYWCEERIRKMENLFHNRSAAEIAEMAFDAQRRMKAAEEEFDACKAKLIELARGAKLQINVPQICRVTISEPPKTSDKKSYSVNSEAFENLDFETRQRLIDSEVIKERKKSDEPRAPTVRVSPL